MKFILENSLNKALFNKWHSIFHLSKYKANKSKGYNEIKIKINKKYKYKKLRKTLLWI